jgi:zinc/manganese transport system substrate-binding protein
LPIKNTVLLNNALETFLSLFLPSNTLHRILGKRMKSASIWFKQLFMSLSLYILISPIGLSHGADTLNVMASFSILGDLVQVVGGSRVKVTNLVGPDQDAHVFEPKPQDAKNLLQSKLLVLNGAGFEPWAQKLVKSAAYKGTTITTSQNVNLITMPAEKKGAKPEIDPHAWQNPNNVIIYIQNITDTLSQLDPAGATVFKTNSEAYIVELRKFDAWAKSQFELIPSNKRKVITSHDAFGYFAAQYQIAFLAPQGISTEAEPSAKQVAQLIRQIKAEKIKAVFVENMSNPKLISQLSKDAGVTIGEALYADALSSADKPGSTYLKMMRHNVNQLALGMQKN